MNNFDIVDEDERAIEMMKYSGDFIEFQNYISDSKESIKSISNDHRGYREQLSSYMCDEKC